MTTLDIAMVGDAPWGRYGWTGSFVSADGCSTHDFTRENVRTLIAYGDTGEGWDGYSAGLASLDDGRFIAWESDWGPTGSGFCCDAYGGTADIIVALDPGRALQHISEKGRELLVFAFDEDETQLASVLRDAWLEGRADLLALAASYGSLAPYRIDYLLGCWIASPDFRLSEIGGKP